MVSVILISSRAIVYTSEGPCFQNLVCFAPERLQLFVLVELRCGFAYAKMKFRRKQEQLNNLPLLNFLLAQKYFS